jgi:hypothetical protein
MNTIFASGKAGGRDKLAKMLGVKPITTYQPSWCPNLPPKHERFIRAVRPKWAKEWDQSHSKEAPL